MGGGIYRLESTGECRGGRFGQKEDAERVYEDEMMSKGGSLAVEREVKKNKAALKAAKQVVAEKSLGWQSGLRHYENEEPCSEEIGLLSDATAVFNYASKVENSRFRNVIYKALCEL